MTAMLDLLRRRGRNIIAHVLYYSGVLWLLAAIRFHRRALVLTYHRVLPTGADTFSADAIVVRPETFARQMKFLRRHFNVLSVEELAEHFASGRRLPSRSCIVTFDDGWLDNFEHAFPVLRELDVPAAIFVAADYISGETCFWQERLTRLLYLAVQQGAEPLSIAAPLLTPDIARMTPEQQRSHVRQAVDALKRRPRAEVEALESRLKLAMRETVRDACAAGDDRFMSWEQVARLARESRVSIGAHGCSHTPLTTLSEQEVFSELKRSRELIGAAIERPVISVAYPNGNFNDVVIEQAQNAGYLLGFTTDKGPVGTGDHPLKLTRINVHESATRTMPEFLCAILLVFQRFRRPTPHVANAHSDHG